MSKPPQKKYCKQCRKPFYRPAGRSDGTWDNQKYCGQPCVTDAQRAHRDRQEQLTSTVIPEPEFNWKLRAACHDADPGLFESRGPGELDWASTMSAARLYCATCPVIESCAAAADRGRDSGLWGGSYRGVGSAYHRNPLVPNAPMFPLPKAQRWSFTAC